MRRLVPLVLAAVLVALAGCGGGAGQNAHPDLPPPPATPLPRYKTVAQLTKATLAQRERDRTAQFHITGVTSGDTPQTMSGDGSMEFTAGQLAMQLTQRLQKLDQPQGPEFTLVILPSAAFLRPPASASAKMPPGRSWFRIQSNTSSPAMTQFAQAAQSLRQNADPTQGFSRLGNAVSIVESSQEPLDAVWTVRYKISLDLARAAELVTDPGAKGALESLVASGARTDDTTLWVDARSRLLRMVLVRNQPTPQGLTTYTLTTRYRDWGEPVHISPPPDDQVVPN